jgi:hypothetical protein
MEKMWKEQLLQMVKVQDDGSYSNQSLVGATLLALELGNEEVLGKVIPVLVSKSSCLKNCTFKNLVQIKQG